MKNFSRLVVLVGTAAALSGCNTTGPTQVSGPWGVGYISETGPRYSSPWNAGPLVIVDQQEFIDAGAIDPVFRDVTPRPYRVGVDLPPEPPLPVYSGDKVVSAEAPAAPPYTDDSPPQGQFLPTGGSRQPQSLGGSTAAIPQPPRSTPVAPPSPTRTSFSGSWTAIDNTGARCKIQLTSNNAVDLYRATTNGCSSPELRSVNLWDYKSGIVTLYARDKVVARLNGRSDHLTGSTSDRKISIDMTR